MNEEGIDTDNFWLVRENRIMAFLQAEVKRLLSDRAIAAPQYRDRCLGTQSKL